MFTERHKENKCQRESSHLETVDGEMKQRAVQDEMSLLGNNVSLFLWKAIY